MSKLGFTIFFCACFALGGCKKRSEPVPPPKLDTQAATAPVQNQPALAKFDACAFITRQEIAEIEGSAVKDTKNSGRSDGGLSFAQCFFTTEEFNRSVSLAVTKIDSDVQPKRSVKEYWEEMFGKFEKEDKERGAEKAENEADKEKRQSLREQRKERGEEGEGAPPKKVEGVGEEAFWLGNRVGGALYVLHKEAFVRVSVGGPDPEDKKIEKCKALAQKAISRL